MNLKLPQYKKRTWLFLLAFVFQISALLMMAYDPTPQGFGIVSLTIAPIFLFIGFLLPVISFYQSNVLVKFKDRIVSEPLEWIGFLISFLVSIFIYIWTLEPTASLWDCSETIATAYKLQVPHTPGTPLMLLIARLFSMLALGNLENVAWYINFMSAFFSSIAVAFIFLIIWHMGNRIVKDKLVVLFGGLGGALCLAFSDSFWFSAVEAETYGISMFFITFMIWMSIQGSTLQGEEKKLRLFQLSYLIGLSYCIHPMCILVLPVCAILWKSDNLSNGWKSIITSIAAGIALVLFISKVIAVDIFEWAFQLDFVMVNRLSLPLYSGVFLLILIIIGAFAFVWRKWEKSGVGIAVVGLITLGFTPYLMLFIRSSHLPPINEFSPNNLAKIKPYMNRESYPSRPLLYGPYFDAELERTSPKAKSYVLVGDKYEAIGEIPQYHYEKERMTILPRIYSNDASHIAAYREWTGLKEGEKPRFLHNLTFMFKYQLGHMYMRYFMWNFAGRTSDYQHAEWMRPWKGLVDRSSEGYSEATNQYFMLPFLIGLLGLLFQLKRDRKNFVATLTFFLVTGFLLAIYLNATPIEPRERDYIYVGSYAAFCIWVGVGFMACAHLIKDKKNRYVTGVIALGLSVWMLYQNWDDHDRSNRTFHMDHARALLNSCEKDAILFTGGDNDTFPLWYLQEVEGFRTDVRVKVMSYFNADWYINQLTRQYYDSPPLNLSLQTGESQYGPYNPLYIYEKTASPILWDKYIVALKNKNPSIALESSAGSTFYYLPSRRIDIHTREGVIQTTVDGAYLQKNEMAILDVLHSNGWERPIYFNFTSLNGLNINLENHLRQEGLVYRLVQEKSSSDGIEMDLKKTYENLMNVDYSNLKDPDIYFNHEDYEMRMIVPIKYTFNNLIQQYGRLQDKDKVEELTTFAYEKLYFDHLEASYADLQLASFMKGLGKEELSEKLLKRAFQFFYERIQSQIDLGEIISRNQLIIFQEATRLLEDDDYKDMYMQLMERLSVEDN